MKKIIYLSLLLLLTNCKAQHNHKKNTKIKTFDIATFEKNKDENNEYIFYINDSIIIKQSDDVYEYYEKVKDQNSYFYTINRYYKNGILKLTGKHFLNNFQKGIWKEYDEQGNLIKETNYDAPYKFTWENVLDFIKMRDIDMTSRQFQVIRSFDFGNFDEAKKDKPYWAITYEDGSATKKVIILNGINGTVMKEFEEDYPIEDDNMDEFPPPKE